MELEDCHRLDYALDLAQNLHCYHFMPRDMDLADFGKELAKRDGIYPKDELLATCFDAEGYANQRMKRMGLSAAEHGFVSWNGTEPVYEYSPVSYTHLAAWRKTWICLNSPPAPTPPRNMGNT